MNEESKRPNIDPELEARIIALVLGEASDFEDQQLNKLIEFRPDLAAFKSEMQRVHGLLTCLLYTSPSPRDQRGSRMPSSA